MTDPDEKTQHEKDLAALANLLADVVKMTLQTSAEVEVIAQAGIAVATRLEMLEAEFDSLAQSLGYSFEFEPAADPKEMN